MRLWPFGTTHLGPVGWRNPDSAAPPRSGATALSNRVAERACECASPTSSQKPTTTNSSAWNPGIAVVDVDHDPAAANFTAQSSTGML
jgi:hypothetical protein